MASIIRRKAGYQVQIRRKGLPQVSKCFRSRREAIAWARQTETKLEQGLSADYFAAHRTTTLGELLIRYRDEVTSGKKGRGPETDRINRILGIPLAQRPLAGIRAAEIAAYRDERLAVVSGDAINRELTILSAVFETARKEWGMVANNPAKLARRAQANAARHRRRMTWRSSGSSYTPLVRS
jgi:hypothetical protein